MEKVYHIYAKNKCILHSIKEEDFEVAWNTLKKMIDIVKTEYHIEDLSFEELYINKDITLSSSHWHTLNKLIKWVWNFNSLMAKGFTVKAAAPKTSASEWNYDSIKERMKGKSIVFCLPGRGCSFTFLKAFVQLCFDLVQNGMSIQISQDYSSMVNFARCKVLGANVLRGPKQVPWDGKLNYDYQLWIDSDIVFNSEKFWQLCDLALSEDEEGKEIVAGWYATEDGHTTSVAHWLEEDDFRKNGGVMNHETVESISKRRKPFTVDYTGFGWVLIKKGVFENLEYPWFAPKMQVFESGAVQDMCGEDVSFCLDAIEKGYEIWCDPRVRVGHEKTRVIWWRLTNGNS